MRRLFKTGFSRIVWLAVVGLSGCGATGCVHVCGDFVAEYAAQYGLVAIDAAALNDAGFTGTNVNVAIADSGIDSAHAEFDGRTINGVNYVGTGTFGSDENGHGTHVSGIIGANKDSNGMRGVAYDANLFSYKIINAAGFVTGVSTDAEFAALYNQHVTDDIDVSNNSWGSTTLITATTEAALRAASPLSIAAITAAQTSGTIFVWAAGNSGQAQVSIESGAPYFIAEHQPQWLTVVAVDSSLKETAYTNRCGLAQDFCVTAPGGGDNQAADGIYSVQSGGTYVRFSGTSMAAPHVSGVVALLREKFPALTSAAIVTRIKTTATLTGLTGFFGCTVATCTDAQMRAIFGHGLVNPPAAILNIGNLNYAAGDNVFGKGNINLNQSKLSLPAGLGASVRAKIGAAQFLAFDSFDGATFSISGDTVFESAPSSTMSVIGYSSADPISEGEKANYYSIAMLADDDKGLPPMFMSESADALNLGSLSMWGEKASLLPTPSFIQSEPVRQFEFLAANLNGVRLQPYVQVASLRSDELMSGFGVNMIYDLGRKTRLSTSFNQAMTGFNFDAVSTDQEQRAAVRSVEVGLRHQLSSNWEFFARSAFSQTDGFAASTVSWGLDNASFQRSTIGMEFKSRSGALLSFGMYDPGHFSSGQLSILTASGRTTKGAVSYQSLAFDAGSTAEYAGFLAAKIPMNIFADNDGTFSFALQQSPYDLSKIERADLSLSVSF